MAMMVSAPNCSVAWLSAMGELLGAGGKAVNLAVSFPGNGQEDLRIRRLLDGYLEERLSGSVRRVSTVANRVFPRALYPLHLGSGARQRLYENYELEHRVAGRDPANRLSGA